MNKFRIKTKKHMKVVGPFQENSSEKNPKFWDHNILPYD